MIAMRRLLAILAIAIVIIVLPSSATAQQADISAIQKQFDKFYAVGNFTAAVAEGKKLEAAVRARLGTSHPTYALALKCSEPPPN